MWGRGGRKTTVEEFQEGRATLLYSLHVSQSQGGWEPNAPLPASSEVGIVDNYLLRIYITSVKFIELSLMLSIIILHFVNGLMLC